MLAEFWRVLVPGDVVRIIVPDGELYLRNYVNSPVGSGDSKLPYSELDAFKKCYTPMMSVNRIFRAHGHMFIFDFDTLNCLLERNRFSEIKRESYMIGRDKKLLLDTDIRQVESLYVKARKPFDV
jgi:predicted SAM-dependent methyltransferase